ncbi:MAG: GNAT family N-acetyltransferase [Candidatus Rokuibacteriota bacterium]|nr:MAG: GNAT family N-acetyltransferase [Candidatus Rokubacteria bacterium]
MSTPIARAYPVEVVELRIVEVEAPADVAAARTLFLEYAGTIGIDLCFQDFEAEVEALPGAYSSPAGRLLLGLQEDDLAGCVALRPLEEGVCELKRLYVRPAFRGRGVGAQLAEAVIGAARELGYERVRLDTLPSMEAALRLYERLGFREIESYYSNPVAGARFLELILPPAV